ncbi:MAG: hypothetical protein EBR26_05385 [Microbacteriaceae bacterium]|nr:hypothetical protein [Microbacteriaceae bacterium]
MVIPTAEEYLNRANKLAKSFQVRDLSSSEVCLLAALQLFPDQSKLHWGKDKLSALRSKRVIFCVKHLRFRSNNAHPEFRQH